MSTYISSTSSPPLGASTTVRELGSRVPAPLPPPFFPRLRGLPWSGVLSSPAAPAIEEGEQKDELACWVRWMWGIWGSGRYAVWYGMDGKGWREEEGERLYSYLRRNGATEVKRGK